MEDIFQLITNKEYNICYRVEKSEPEKWIRGELINYNSGNVILYNREKQVIYHIPYAGIRWMLPTKGANKDRSN